ncbi:hypothetical protein ACQJBY_028844 [Aegilops geniculata]
MEPTSVPSSSVASHSPGPAQRQRVQHGTSLPKRNPNPTRPPRTTRSAAASLTPSRLVVTALHRTAGIADVPQTAAWRSRGQPTRAGSRRDRWAQPVIGGVFAWTSDLVAPPRHRLTPPFARLRTPPPTACCYFPPAGEKAAAASDASPHLTPSSPAPRRTARRKVLEREGARHGGGEGVDVGPAQPGGGGRRPRGPGQVAAAPQLAHHLHPQGMLRCSSELGVEKIYDWMCGSFSCGFHVLHHMVVHSVC